MRWYWRAAISIAVGSVWLGWILGSLLSRDVFPAQLFRWLGTLVTEALESIGLNTRWREFITTALILGPILCGIPVLCYVALSRYAPKQILERETRCRKCHYILRGITEPRCPECGEVI